jgi:hypothetical protein
MKIKRLKTPLEQAIAELRSQSSGITRLQGHPDAETFLLAPFPTKAELDANLAWCDKRASEFFNWMQAEIGLQCNKDFLIMPGTSNAEKPKKDNTALGLKITQAAAADKHIKRFVVIGSEPFKAYIGFGKKPSMSSLVGNIMYLPAVNHKPVFVFPDLDALNYDATIRYKTKRDWAIAFFGRQKMIKTLDALVPKFRQFMKLERL